MTRSRIASIPAFAALMALTFASDALAQVCIGLPARDGEMSLQGAIIGHAEQTGVGYAGRLGINFNTPLTLDVALERPRTEDGLGTTVSGEFAFEIYDYEPSICPYGGVRYETMPTAAGEDVTATSIPVGIGFGKRLGSARGLSLALFAIPEYVYVLEPAGSEVERPLLDQIGDRSEARGTLGLLMATPLIYATGSVRVTTVDTSDPTFSLGLGMTF